jgi:hypothetical protein
MYGYAVEGRLSRLPDNRARRGPVSKKVSARRAVTERSRVPMAGKHSLGNFTNCLDGSASEA